MAAKAAPAAMARVTTERRIVFMIFLDFSLRIAFPSQNLTNYRSFFKF